MLNSKKNIAVIILAAGMGTRMKSDKAKVLHEINGRPMILYVVDSAIQVAGDNVIVVVGHQAESVRRSISETNSNVTFALQEKRLGTGHAVMCAMPYIKEEISDVVILCGDTPLITSDTIQRLLKNHIELKRDATVLGVETDNPSGYGRILLDDKNNVTRIIEEADATENQKNIKIINSGIYCVSTSFLSKALSQIGSENAQGEFYLTDIIEIGYKENSSVGAIIESCFEETLGVNTISQLQLAENIMKQRLS